jgi:hypothetical protein
MSEEELFDVGGEGLGMEDICIRLDDSDYDQANSNNDIDPETSTIVRKRQFNGRTDPSQKCGKCKHCMNPHWHKRCLELPATNMKRSSAKAKPKDPFVDNLKQILSSDGGIKGADHVPALQKLFRLAEEWSQRKALLKVLQVSAPVPLKLLISKGGLLDLEKWLTQAIAHNRPKFVAEMLSTLSYLPVTLESLRKPCEMGKVVGKLRKSDMGEDIRAQARILVTKWKSLVETRTPVKSSTGPPAASANKPVVKQKVPQTGLGDADLFNLKPQKKVAPPSATATNQRVRVVASNAAKSQIVDGKRITSVAKVSESPLDALSHHGSPQFVKPHSQAPSKPRTVLTPANTALSNQFSMLSGPLTAAQRAKMAADSVPDVSPRKKSKDAAKKITWAAEKDLVSVRLFLKHQPPSMAAEDANPDDMTPADEPTSVSETHEEFEKAAKQQHFSEAQALKDFKAQEGLERKVIEERLHEMRPMVAWKDPPEIPRYIFEEYGKAARGEESKEKEFRENQRSVPNAEVISATGVCPPSPDEPPVGASFPMQPIHLIPKIPLSISEARKPIPVPAVTPGHGVMQQQPRPIGMAQTGIRAPRQPQPMARGQQIVQPRQIPMTVKKFGGPMLGLHGANKAQQATMPQNPLVPRPQQIGPRPMMVSDNRPVCAYFNKPRGCIHGDKCKFSHPVTTPANIPILPNKRVTPQDGHDTAAPQPRKMVKHGEAP